MNEILEQRKDKTKEGGTAALLAFRGFTEYSGRSLGDVARLNGEWEAVMSCKHAGALLFLP